MLLALFAIMILTSLVSVVLMASISQQAKTRKATDFTFAGQAADTAVNDALMLANLNGTFGTVDAVDYYNGTTLPRTRKGVSEDFMWSWYSTQSAAATSTWEITATGCRNAGTATSPVCTASKTRKIKAILSGAVVQSADNSSGEAGYVLTPKRGFNRALFADQDLIMQGSSTVTAYNSATGAQVPGSGHVATNGLADFGGPLVKVDGIYMLNTQTHSSGDRCNDYDATNGQCKPTSTPRLIHDIGPKLKISDTLSPTPPQFITTQVNTCITAGGPLTAWVASKATPKGKLGPGTQCYSSMNFDESTTVTGAVGNPTVVYVTGPITIGAGFKINMNDLTMPKASQLQIFSSGPVVSLGGGALETSRTEVAWALWAPYALCAPSKSTGFVTVYGAMVCQKIFTQGAFVARWDEALRELGKDNTEKTVWDISVYEDGA